MSATSSARRRVRVKCWRASSVTAGQVKDGWPLGMVKRFAKEWKAFRNWELGEVTRVVSEEIRKAGTELGVDDRFASRGCDARGRVGGSALLEERRLRRVQALSFMPELSAHLAGRISSVRQGPAPNLDGVLDDTFVLAPYDTPIRL